MGYICPKDLKPCIDDLCRVSNECLLGYGELLCRCHGCGGIQSEFFDDCTCEPDDDDLTGFDYTGGGR